MTLFIAGLFLSLISVALVVRLHRGRSPREYMPVLIESSLPFLFFAVAALPVAFPAFFQRLLGHSTLANYTRVRGSDGMKITETWFLGRWLEPIHSLGVTLIVVGIVWACWNLTKKSSRVSNIVALVLGIVWILAQLMRHLVLTPFD